MRKILAACLIAALALSAAALCGCRQSSHAYTFTDGCLEAKGKAVTVRLDGNPTTGYEWTYRQTGGTLALVSQDYEASGTGTESGAGGVYTFTFEGKAAGTSTLTFTYARSWESSPDDAVVTVEVTTDSSGTVIETETVTKDGISYGGR